MSGRKRSPDLKSDHARYEFAKDLIRRWAPSISPASGRGEEPEDGWVSVGFSPVGLQLGEVKLDPLHVSYLGQAAMWYSVARLLGERARTEPDPIKYLIPHFTGTFQLEWLEELVGAPGEFFPPRTENEVIDLLNRMRDKYWSKLPNLRGRPPVMPPPVEAFRVIPDLQEKFQATRTDAVKKYRDGEWASARPLRRIAKESGAKSRRDQAARRVLESMSFPLDMLSDPGVMKFAVSLLGKRPIQAALEVACVVAKRDHGYQGSPTSFSRAWHVYEKWRSTMSENLTE